MALFRLEAKIHSRTAKGKDGKPIAGKTVSIVSKAAYRSGESLKNEQTGQTFNYKARSQEVVHSEILLPANAPAFMKDRQQLWNAVEKAEKRKDSQLSREFIISLPVELKRQGQIEAVRNWCQAEIVDKGFVADISLHQGKADGHNPHAHILTTLRPVEGGGFGKKPDSSGKFNGRGEVGRGAKSDLAEWRESWEREANRALEAAEIEARVDRRSLADRGIDRKPAPKLGVTAAAMERRGIETRRGAVAMAHAFAERVASMLRMIEGGGEVKHSGLVGAWWQIPRAALDTTVDAVRQIGREAAGAGRDLWQDQSSFGRLPELHVPPRTARERVERQREPDAPDFSR